MSYSKREVEIYKEQRHKAKFKTPGFEEQYAKKNTKKCSKCNIEKKLTEYSGNCSGCDAFDSKGYRLRRPECKICKKNGYSV